MFEHDWSVCSTRGVNCSDRQLGTYPSSRARSTHVGVGADAAEECWRVYGIRHSVWRGVTMNGDTDLLGGDERGNDFAVPRRLCLVRTHRHPDLHAAAQPWPSNAEAAALRSSLHRRRSTSEGAFYEALNLAERAPAVYSSSSTRLGHISSDEGADGREKLWRKGGGRGHPGSAGRRNDVLPCARRSPKRSSRAARRGRVYRDAEYRLSDHTTADDASATLRPRSQDAWALEPLIRDSDISCRRRTVGRGQGTALAHE